MLICYLRIREYQADLLRAFSRRAKTLRYRMRETMQEKKKRRGLWILFLVMFLSCFFPGRMIFATDRTTVGEVLGEHIHDIKEVTYTYSSDHKNQQKLQRAEKQGRTFGISVRSGDRETDRRL